MRRVKAMLWVMALMVLSACASDKAPAEQAIKAAEAAVAEVRAEAGKWLPDQVRALEASLTSVKDKFAKGDYKAVLAEAPAIASRAKEVATAAAAKKMELTKTWEQLAPTCPRWWPR